MASKKSSLSDSLGELVITRVLPCTLDIYMVPEDRLERLREKRLWTDVFLGLTTLFVGIFITILVDLTTSATSTNESRAVLDILVWVFAVLSLGTLVLWLLFAKQGSGVMKDIKRNRLQPDQSPLGETAEAPQD